MKIKSKNASAIRPTAISIPNRLQRAPAHAHYIMSAFETFYLNGRHIHGPRRRWRWLDWIFTLHISVTRGWKCKWILQLQLLRTSSTNNAFLFLLFASATYIMRWAVSADDGDLCNDLFLKILDAVWKRCRTPGAHLKMWILNVPNGLWNAKLCNYYKWYMPQWRKACLRHEEVRQLSWDNCMWLFLCFNVPTSENC